MKVVPFKIPKTEQEAVKVQIDNLTHFYNHLHQHPEIQLTLIKESSGTLLAGNYVGRFDQEDVLVIGSNLPHIFRNDPVYFKKKLRARSTTLFFDANVLGNQFLQISETNTLLPFLKNSIGGYRIVGNKKNRLRELILAIENTKGFDKLILFLEVLKLLSNKKEMLVLSTSLQQKVIGDFDGTRINKVLEHTFRESHRNIMLVEIAGVANLTVEAFCKYFKTRTGKTYVNFLNEIRIQNACKLLLNNDQPVSLIGYETGFNNLSNFNRIFKKIIGMSPREFRKESR